MLDPFKRNLLMQSSSAETGPELENLDSRLRKYESVFNARNNSIQLASSPDYSQPSMARMQSARPKRKANRPSMRLDENLTMSTLGDTNQA